MMRRWLKQIRNVVMAGAICGGPPGASSCPGGGELTSSYGYLEVRPPSALFEPGAMIALLHEHPLEAAIVCGPRGSLGSEHVAERSRTMGQALSKLNQKTIDLDVTLTDKIRGNLRFEKIRHIRMEISNARVIEVGDEAVIRGRRRRSRDCAECIANRISAGFKPVMISSALSGDMIFHVLWESDAKMSAKAKIDLLSQLAVELGGGVTSITESTITVDNLVFGIRYSRYLAAMSMPDPAQTSVDLDDKPVRESIDIRITHGTSSIKIDPVPDAPVIMPSGFDPASIGWVDQGNLRTFNKPLPSLREGAPLFAPSRPISRESVQRNLAGQEATRRQSIDEERQEAKTRAKSL